ncbi:hypothetical protein LSAT2_009438 [Lamellibrachia satsuma]|nr:hypothetical protein LSAT2_009438 [Lamellibrachia satsuma]
MGNKYSDQPVQTGSSVVRGAANMAGGLSEREQKAIRLSWKKISTELKINGRDFFVKFFEFYPVYIDYFPAFRGKSVDELCRSPLVQAHGISVMYSFTTLVENLNDLGFFNKFLSRNMRAHEGRGVGLRQYESSLLPLEHKAPTSLVQPARSGASQLSSVISSQSASSLLPHLRVFKAVTSSVPTLVFSLQEIFEVLILFLEEKLDSRFDEFTRSAWEHFAEEFSDAVMNLEGSDVVFE